jgi:decaprenylphospho-beta-D-ribofuranose 2-oxidase
MPPAELLASPPLDATPAVVHGWGGADPAAVSVLRPGAPGTIDVEGLRRRGAIPRGLGRSYGDAAQLSQGYVIETSSLRRVDLDRDQGIVTAEAGATIGELLDLTVPAGWMVPVVPGTQHVTVGGAIASDIHGKNHGTAGTFGSYVRSLGLLTADGETVELTPESELFQATVGGMGLTGVVVWAAIACYPVRSAAVAVDTDRAADFDQAFELLRAPGGPLRVAWIDLLGSRPGRGVVTRAEHCPESLSIPSGPPSVRARAVVPAWWPGGLLRAGTVGVFNELRYRGTPHRQRGHVEPLGPHLFPLDVLDAWPRLYGAPGFVQYQLVVPPDEERTLIAVTEHVRRAGIPCFLAVLKDMGPANAAPLSFPIEGWTLTLDLPRSAAGLGAALDRCDELVAEVGGRVYLTKDARMGPDAVRAMYPRLAEWQVVRDGADPDGVWRSDLALRTGLVQL